jgi:hypothetical protein
MGITSEVSSVISRPDGQLLVRRIDTDSETGDQVVHRHVVVPGADLNVEDAKVKKVGQSVHTVSVISAYRASLAE